MGYFPFFVEIENSRWLIAGGGAVALRKARQLLPFGASVKVVSPEIIPAFHQLREQGWGERLAVIQRDFQETDIQNIQFVIAATSSPKLNGQIGALCHDRGIPVNVADAKENCSFLFPSLLKDGDVTIGITTGGTSPALARLIKSRVASSLPLGVGELADQLGRAREVVKKTFPHSPKARTAVFSLLARTGMERGCRLTMEEIHEIINRKLEQEHE